MSSSSGDLFEINRQLWARFCAKQSLMLPYVKTGSWQRCSTAAGEPNLKKTDGGKEFFLCSKESSKEEADCWFASLDLEGVGVLYVYGIGMGCYYERAKKWLEADSRRQLIFLEDDLAVISFFLHTETALSLLKNEQCHLYHFESLEESKEILNTLFWSCCLTPVEVCCLASYKIEKKELYEALKNHIEYDVSLKNSSLDEYLSLGNSFFLNFYPNMHQLHRSLLGNNLFGRFNAIPAIICGAGPSLTKQLPLLSDLFEKALIFGGGSSLNALSSCGIIPHFGANIDPNPMQLERVVNNNCFETPIFYRNRLFHKAFEMIHGPRLYITGSGGYDIAPWFEEQLGITYEQELSEGFNVLNFCIQIAAALGCNPIILVGMDLAYTGLQLYAQGVTEQSEALEPKKLNLVERKDVFGQTIYTEWKWLVEADWITNFSKENPSVAIINATEGGIAIPDIPNSTLKNAVDKYLVRQWDLRSRVMGELARCRMEKVTKERVEAAMNTLLESLRRCVALTGQLIEENDIIRQRIKNNPQDSSQLLQTGKSVLYETDLEEEAGYTAVLQIFNQIYNHLLERDLRLIYKSVKKQRWADQELKKIELADRKYSFLTNAAKFNILAIEKVLKGEL